ncbi:24609_t:CDS:2, partial [Gigaspora rosea]
MLIQAKKEVTRLMWESYTCSRHGLISYLAYLAPQLTSLAGLA